MLRTSLQTWMAHLLETGSAPGTVLARKQSVKRFADWLLATGQVHGHPFLGVKGPAQRRHIVLPLSDDELRALIATCTHPVHRPDESLHHRRDEALIRLMLETGIRAGELVALDLADLDLDIHRITVRRGKGGHLRTIPVGTSTIAAIRGYLPERAQHPAAEAHGCGWGSAAPPSATTASTRPCAAAPSTPASPDSTCTGSGTPPPTAGSPPAAPNPD
jgi:site-specific recombinase XerC